MSLKLDWCSYEAAKYACEHWHYSKTMPSGKLVRIGTWENEKFIGAIVFGLGAAPNLCKSYGLKMTECCELARVALTKHSVQVTRILAIALKLLKRKCPGIRLVVSFADNSQNHHGGIYQGGNWIFSGSANLDHWIINGKKMHPRSVVAKYGTQKTLVVKKIDLNAKKIWGIKYRYLMPLDNEIKKQIIVLAKPYPKRASSVESSMTDFRSVGGGESPTEALQFCRFSNKNRSV